MDAELERLCDEVLAATFEFYPSWAARLGLHEYDGQLGTFTPEALDRRVRELRRWEQALRQFSRERLSPRGALDLEVLLAAVERELFELEDLRPYSRNPLVYADALDVTAYVKRDYAPLDQRVLQLAEHLQQLPSFLAQAKRSLEPVCPRPFVTTALELFEGGLEFLTRQLDPLVRGASPRALGRLAEVHTAAVGAVRAFVGFLRDELLPRASEDFALGPERYRRMLWATERISLGPDALRQTAETELDRLRDHLEEAARRVDPHRPAHEVVRALSREHPTAEELVPYVEKVVEELRAFLREHPVVTVPEPSHCRVEPTPPFLRWAFALMDTAGPFESQAVESYYYVTLPDPSWPETEKEAWLSRFDVYTLRTTTVHEAYPGHHVHFLRLRQLPSRVARAFTSYAFVEGWAHYCEEMVLECGYGAGEPRLQVAQLADALVRAVRFRASLGLHTEGWTLEQAVRRFVEDAHLEVLPARKEAERGTFDPGYLSYTLGKLVLKDVRAELKRRTGSGFCLREFHDRLLDLGAPPVALVRGALLGPDGG